MARRTGNLAIVTPTHIGNPGIKELALLKKSLDLNRDIKHFFVVPKEINTDSLSSKFPNSEYVVIEPKHFESTKTYNRLMLSPHFYEFFLEYDYILILQLDAVLLRKIDSRDYAKFDYVGAPWGRSLRVTNFRGDLHGSNKRLFWLPFTRIQVGNGGLSFRRVGTILELLQRTDRHKFCERVFDGSHNEDFVLGYLLIKSNLRVPAPELARKIFLEEDFEFCTSVPAVLGIHAPFKHNPQIAKLFLHQN